MLLKTLGEQESEKILFVELIPAAKGEEERLLIATSARS